MCACRLYGVPNQTVLGIVGLLILVHAALDADLQVTTPASLSFLSLPRPLPCSRSLPLPFLLSLCYLSLIYPYFSPPTPPYSSFQPSLPPSLCLSHTHSHKHGHTYTYMHVHKALITTYILHTDAVECRDDEFRCNSTRCIPSHWVCDGLRDCADGRDESDRQCPSEYFPITITNPLYCCLSGTR